MFPRSRKRTRAASGGIDGRMGSQKQIHLQVVFMFLLYVTLTQAEMYRDEIYSLQILLSRSQAGPGRTVKQQQEEISPNHVQRLNLISVNVFVFVGIKVTNQRDCNFINLK